MDLQLQIPVRLSAPGASDAAGRDRKISFCSCKFLYGSPRWGEGRTALRKADTDLQLQIFASSWPRRTAPAPGQIVFCNCKTICARIRRGRRADKPSSQDQFLQLQILTGP